MSKNKLTIDLDSLVAKSYETKHKNDTSKVRTTKGKVETENLIQNTKSSLKLKPRYTHNDSFSTTTNTKITSSFKEFPWFIKLFSFLLFIALMIIIPIYTIKGTNLIAGLLKDFNIDISGHSVVALIAAEPKLKTDGYGRTNILLVGIDSRRKNLKDSRGGLQNTDTIILASYDHNKHALYLISFPRDTWVKYPNTYYYNKINAVYAYGERINPGHGLDYLKSLIEKLSGLKIQYYAMVNFDGFKKIIDKLGGVDVYVERSFVDYSYPKGHGYMTVKFNKGWNHFSGERALQYARSRKAAGPEGSDFARARRQQKIIQAVIDKFKKKGISDPKFVYNILKVISNNIILSRITPLDVQAGLELLKKGKPKMYSLVLEPSIGNYSLIGRGNTTLYTLVPKAGIDNWTFVKRFIRDWMCAPEMVTKNPTIYVYNANDPNYYADYRTITRRYFYYKIVPGGYWGKTFTGKVITSPNNKFTNAAKCISSNTFLKYKEFSDDNIPKKIKGKDLVIILGK